MLLLVQRSNLTTGGLQNVAQRVALPHPAGSDTETYRQSTESAHRVKTAGKAAFGGDRGTDRRQSRR